MSIQGGGLPDHCTQCREPLEIVAVSFPFLKPCTAVFSCSSCGLTFSEDNEGRKPQRPPVAAHSMNGINRVGRRTLAAIALVCLAVLILSFAGSRLTTKNAGPPLTSTGRLSGLRAMPREPRHESSQDVGAQLGRRLSGGRTDRQRNQLARGS